MRLWKFLSARAVAAALTEAGYPVSEDVVQRWKKAQKPDPRAVDKLAEVLGIRPDTENEPPEPAWVGRLEARLIELRENQDRVAQEAAAGVVTALAPPVREQWAARIEETLDDIPKRSDEAPAGSPDTEGLGGEVPQGPERG